MGGKWLFFISLRCDGVLGPRARGAGCKLRCETVPTESWRACWSHMGTDGPVYSDSTWLPASLVSSKASILQSGLFSIAHLRKKAVLESKLRGESSSGDHFYSSDQLWRPKIAVRYAAAVLKPMSARRVSLPRARYGGAHHSLIAPPHARAGWSISLSVELARSTPPKQNSTSDAERARLCRSPRRRRGKPQRRREPRWPTRCSRRRTEPAPREERDTDRALERQTNRACATRDRETDPARSNPHHTQVA